MSSPEYEVRVFDVRTGTVLAELGYSDSSWSRALNDSESAEVTCPVDMAGRGAWSDLSSASMLRGISTGLWRFGIAILWGTYVCWAGPIVTAKPSIASVQFGATGLLGLFNRRRLMVYGAVDPASASATVRFTGRSLAGIAQGIIQQATAEYGRELPLDYLPITVTGEHERTYNGYDYKSAGEALTQLAEVIDGPDFSFDPILVRTDSGEQIRWQVRIGQPRLGDPTRPITWDYGTSLRELSMDIDGSSMTSYVAVPGDGQENAKIFGTAFTNELVDLGWPPLEDVNSEHSSSSNREELNSYAAAHLAAYKRPLVSWSATVDPALEPRLGTWQIGDWGRFDITHHPMLDGELVSRITGVSYRQGLLDLTITDTLQEV